VDPVDPARRPMPLARRARRWGVFVALATIGLAPMNAASAQTDGPRVLATTVEGPITPVIAAHLADGIDRASREGYAAYLVRLDTPGGLDPSMRSIVRDILASDVPVIVHITPQGARGASAGAIIAFSAHIAAMAPGTTIGAATPVAGGSGEDLDAKVINDAVAYAEGLAELRDRDRDLLAETVRDGRSVSASEALEAGGIDLIASSDDELLDAIDGMALNVSGDREVILETAGAVVDDDDLGVLRAIQQRLADPNIAFLLLSIGTLGLIYELASPGLGVGGALGITFILLALFGLAVLPVNVVGILFLVLAAALFVAEVFAPGIGLAAAGGMLSLVLSGIFLIDDAPGLQLSLAVILPTAILVGGFVILAGRIAMRVRTAPSTTTGGNVLMGQEATVVMTKGKPQAVVRGAWWNLRPADPASPLVQGSRVRVTEVDGLELVVEPTPTPTTVGADEKEKT
jgi:membrane-bound serine protease (ClpP class)